MTIPQVNLTFPKGPCKSSTFSGGLFIDGKFVESVSGKTIDVTDPGTGKVIAQVSEAGKEDVDLAVKAADRAQKTVWGLNMPGNKRAKLLMAMANAIEAHFDELTAIEALDSGKNVFKNARGDVQRAIDLFTYYAGWCDKHSGKTIEGAGGEGNLYYTRHEPVGVCGMIVPWQFPIFMTSIKLAPALACGCAIVLKSSEVTPLSALFLAKLAQDIFPPGVFNIVSGYGQTAGAALSEHMLVRKIAFTGSGGVGRIIMKAAAQSNFKVVTLELGGKSPNIIYDDADIEEAVKWTAMGVFFNQGQMCVAGSRVFVQEAIYDQFVEKLAAYVKTRKVGSNFDEENSQGPQVSQAQLDRIMSYVKLGPEEGAKLYYGGERIGTEGYFMEPTIFTEVKPNMKIYQEEIFGPVVSVIRFKDEDDVVAMANDSVYGLASGVFSRDITRALRTGHRLEAGTVWVNSYLPQDIRMPFGGFKQSGIGREMGEYGLSAYTAVKSVLVNLDQKAPGY